MAIEPDVMPYNLWKDATLNASHMNAVFEALGFPERVQNGEMVVPCVQRLCDLIKERCAHHDPISR